MFELGLKCFRVFKSIILTSKRLLSYYYTIKLILFYFSFSNCQNNILTHILKKIQIFAYKKDYHATEKKRPKIDNFNYLYKKNIHQ